MRWWAAEGISLSIIIRQSIESLMHLGKDWILMLQSYLILSLELLHEDWIQKLLQERVQLSGFWVQSQNFKTF